MKCKKNICSKCVKLEGGRVWKEFGVPWGTRGNRYHQPDETKFVLLQQALFKKEFKKAKILHYWICKEIQPFGNDSFLTVEDEIPKNCKYYLEYFLTQRK